VGLPGCENGFVRLEDLCSTSSTPDKSCRKSQIA
jgi:hypothetical protein